MKPSSLFSTPRKKRKAVPSATAAVQLSEVARGPSPRHPRVRRAAVCVTQLQPKRRARPERNSYVSSSVLCPASSPAQHPVSHIPRPEHPHCTEDAEPHSDSAGRCWKQVTIVLYFPSPFHRCKQTGSHGRKAKHSVLRWMPFFMPLPNLETQRQHFSLDCCLSQGS